MFQVFYDNRTSSIFFHDDSLLFGAFIKKNARLLQSLVFFSFFEDRLEATNVKINVQLLITVLLKYWQRIQDSAKGPPFQLVHFYRKIQNRTRL